MVADTSCSGGVTWGYCTTGPPTCNSETEYQSLSVVVSCVEGSYSGSTNIHLVGLADSDTDSVSTGMTAIATFPAGISDLQVAITASFDVDIAFMDLDMTPPVCAVGSGCVSSVACASKTDYCISYSGMPFHFSGDGMAAGLGSVEIVEILAISGVLKQNMSLVVRSKGTGSSTVSYSYQRNTNSSGSASCQAQAPLPGCALCSSYQGCGDLETPQCDGGYGVVCHLADTSGNITQNFTVHDGYLVGTESLLAATMTVAEAKDRCMQLEGCVGFTVRGEDAGEPMNVFFKNRWQVSSEGGEGWTSYRLEERSWASSASTTNTSVAIAADAAIGEKPTSADSAMMSIVAIPLGVGFFICGGMMLWIQQKKALRVRPLPEFVKFDDLTARDPGDP